MSINISDRPTSTVKLKTPSISKLNSRLLPTKSISKYTPDFLTPTKSAASLSTESSSKFSNILQSTYFKIFLLIFILSYLGINLFKILANATDETVDAVRGPLNKILGIFGYTISKTSKQIVKLGADSALFGIDVTSNAAKDAIYVSKEVVGLDEAINVSNKNSSTQTPEPDTIGSEIQAIKKNKSGFCYVGEDRGIRSCVKVDNTQTCMSGDIYPTHDICVNPTLRM